jgi:hypothetical protein
MTSEHVLQLDEFLDFEVRDNTCEVFRALHDIAKAMTQTRTMIAQSRALIAEADIELARSRHTMIGPPLQHLTSTFDHAMRNHGDLDYAATSIKIKKA